MYILGVLIVPQCQGSAITKIFKKVGRFSGRCITQNSKKV